MNKAGKILLLLYLFSALIPVIRKRLQECTERLI